MTESKWKLIELAKYYPLFHTRQIKYGIWSIDHFRCNEFWQIICLVRSDCLKISCEIMDSASTLFLNGSVLIYIYIYRSLWFVRCEWLADLCNSLSFITTMVCFHVLGTWAVRAWCVKCLSNPCLWLLKVILTEFFSIFLSFIPYRSRKTIFFNFHNWGNWHIDSLRWLHSKEWRMFALMLRDFLPFSLLI